LPAGLTSLSLIKSSFVYQFEEGVLPSSLTSLSLPYSYNQQIGENVIPISCHIQLHYKYKKILPKGLSAISFWYSEYDNEYEKMPVRCPTIILKNYTYEIGKIVEKDNIYIYPIILNPSASKSGILHQNHNTILLPKYLDKIVDCSKIEPIRSSKSDSEIQVLIEITKQKYAEVELAKEKTKQMEIELALAKINADK
jgi:hypothetical protein